MDYNIFLKIMLTLVSHGFLGSYVMMLTDFKEPRRVWKLRWFAGVAVVFIVNIILRSLLDEESYVSLIVLTVTIPYLLITMLCSRIKGMRVVFCICTCLWIGCLGEANAIFIQTLFPDYMWVRVLTRAVSYALLYLAVRKFRGYYFDVYRILDRGWGVLCLPSIVTYLTTIYIFNNLLTVDPLPASIVIYSVSAVCTCVYILIYLFFIRARQLYELKNSRDLMSIQISALKRHSDENREAEEKMRVQRRDMRRQWEQIEGLVRQNDKSAILDLIGAAQKRLDETAPPVKWCGNSVINAVVSSYFYRAKQEGIAVEAKLVVSESLPVDATELSMVFANALDNAIKACGALPKEERKIICKCIQSPCLMLQIENTYTGEVEFNEDGLPVSKETGHGIGTRSILAFCEKYDALCRYRAKDGWFRLRVSM